MIYDLTNPLHRKQFVKRCNSMLEKHCNSVELVDESRRSLNQNRYLHVICRILAMETGVTEEYAKNVYFKELANPGIFVQTVTDPLTKQDRTTLRSTSSLSVEEMNKAINTFRHWSEENGYYLPEANPDDEGVWTFSSEKDEQAFHQAEVETSRMDRYL